MKKFIVIIIIVLCGVFFLTSKYYYKENVDNKQIDNVQNNTNLLSLMLETDVGSGIYSVSSSSNWASEEYIFNAELSKCENGSILNWDDNKNTVIMKGNISDKCYLYFDKIDPNYPKPTNPTIAFDNDYNVVLSGSTSKNGSVEYYYSFDNKTFKKGSIVSVNETSTIYAYSKDIKKRKSDVVSKTISISNSTTGSVNKRYYCSHNKSYQTSSSCENTYVAKATTVLDCEEGKYDSTDDYCYITQGSFNDRSTCLQSCKNSAYSQGHTYYCPKDNNKYYCTINVGQRKEITTYSCPNGGTLSDTTCTNTYSGSLKYKCGSTYYNDNASATAACKNYCQSGSYYNSKCYKIS